jgi:hypothetical protein
MVMHMWARVRVFLLHRLNYLVLSYLLVASSNYLNGPFSV